jgi:GxxExxY protein
MMGLIHANLTEAIIGCAMDVYNELGPGFPEKIYQAALACELDLKKINFREQFKININYKNRRIGVRYADFFIEEKIAFELKARTEIEPFHLSQAINYVEATDCDAGLLINFGAKSLQFKRIFNRKRKKPGLGGD